MPNVPRGEPPTGIDTVQKMVLEKCLQIAFQEPWRGGVQPSDVAMAARELFAMTTMHVSAYFMGKQEIVQPGDMARWPATWWQHLKLRWFPKWALKRWPVVWTEIRVRTIYKLCPHVQPDTMGQVQAVNATRPFGVDFHPRPPHRSQRYRAHVDWLCAEGIERL